MDTLPKRGEAIDAGATGTWRVQVLSTALASISCVSLDAIRLSHKVRWPVSQLIPTLEPSGQATGAGGALSGRLYDETSTGRDSGWERYGDSPCTFPRKEAQLT